MEELRRQAGWAKTFGLPLELISADEAKEMFPLMSTEGVLGAAWLPTDGYLDPSQLTFALADGARQGGAPDLHQHPRHRDRGRRRPRAGGRDRQGPDRGRGRGQRRRHVRGRDRPHGRRARPDDPDVAPVPGHPALPRARPGEPAADPARPRPAHLLPRGGRRPGDGRLRAPQRARLPARRARAGSSRSRPTSTAACSRTTGTASRRSSENSGKRVPAMDEVTVTRLINGPEAFTPDNEFCLGETEVGGLLRRRRASAPTGSPGAGGIGKVMAEWIVEGEPSIDLWHMDIRRFGSQYRSPAYTHARDQGDLRDLLRHPLPEPRARGRAAAAGLARQRLAPRARRRLRREVGLGAGQLVRVERRGRGRVAAPARLGRAALVAGDRRRAPRHPRDGGDLRRVLVREDRDRRARRGRLLERLCDNEVARERRARSPTRRC